MTIFFPNFHNSILKHHNSHPGISSWQIASRMGAVAYSPVSHPRSSNRACGTTASGIPTGFFSKHTLDGRFYRSWQHDVNFSENSLRRIPTDAPRMHLIPLDQKMCYAVIYTPFHRPIRNHRRAIAKVSAPTSKQRIQPFSYIQPCPFLTGTQYHPDLLLQATYTGL